MDFQKYNIKEKKKKKKQSQDETGANYTEKRRGRNETEVARRIKGRIQRRETDPASNQFPKCSPKSGTHKEIHRVG